MKGKLIVVCGAGGFIGKHLVAGLLRQRRIRSRAVDFKAFEYLYRRLLWIENSSLDLSD
jgi:nucleoside-diphosphate-sugar epimerase